jgi:hypothetical protein
MQTESESASLATKLQGIAVAFRLVGWLGFWIQLGLAAASGLALAFVVSGRNFSKETTPGIGIGIFWAVCGILVLLFHVYLDFRYTRIARRLRQPNPDLHPKKADVIQILRLGVIVSLVGMLLTILGGGASLGVLLAKSIAQPQGVAIYDPVRIVRALDIFVAMANVNGIAGHFVGTVASLGLLNWLHRP